MSGAGSGREEPAILEAGASGTGRAERAVFRFGEVFVLATSASAATSAGWLVADVARLFERAAGRRPPAGLVVAFDKGESPPESAHGWAYDSLCLAARACRCEPPSARDVARSVRVLATRAGELGIPNSHAMFSFLLRHRSAFGRVPDVARVAGVDPAAFDAARWAVVLPTPRSADALVEHALAESITELRDLEALMLDVPLLDVGARLREAIEAEMRMVVGGAMLLDLDPEHSIAVERRMAAIGLLDRAARGE